MGATAKDIAKALGISTATVSMVFNGYPGISAETRAKVLESAETMGYKRNYKNAASVELTNIQLIFFKSHGNVVSDTPFFSVLTQGIEAEVKKCGLNLLISYFYSNQDVQRQISSIRNSNCAGIILLATEMMAADLKPFENFDIPIVILDNSFPFSNYDSIQINNIQGVMLAVKHLIDCGHTEIGYLSSSVVINNFEERMIGYINGVRMIQSPNNSEKRIVKVSSTADGAFNDMETYLSDKPEMPTAFFADNDIIATSCMRALKKAGYRIPEDISIIGFDDMPICEIVDPPLTTINVPKFALGEFAVDRLLAKIHDSTVDTTVKIEVSTKLVERQSVLKK